MPAQKINLQNAKENKLFYIVANVIVYRDEDGRCLILQRSREEKVHPGKYCVPGGKLQWEDLDISNPTRINGDVLDYENAIEKLLIRETMEEAGVEIEKDFGYINSVAYIRPDGIPTILIKFAAKYKRGEVRLEKGAFIGHAWVSGEEIKDYDCLLGIPKEIASTIKKFS